MKITLNETRPMIDAVDLARLLDLTPGVVQEHMRAGRITSLYERGEGADAGRFRLTFYYDGKRVRLTCAKDGTVLTTLRADVGVRR